MKIKPIIFLLINLILFSSCLEEDYFGESSFADIKKISLSNQSGAAKINTEEAVVTVEIPGGVDLTQITVQALEISSFATSSISVGDVIDISTPKSVTLTSENGTIRNWTIQAFVASETPQLDNRDLNLWYETATGYFEPGESADHTIWATGNRGSQILNKIATTPKDLGGGNLAARMETLSNGPLGAIFGAPISSGSLFTGIFNPDNLDPADPSAATEFGIPFVGRPKAIKFKYSYVPGEINKDKTGTVLDYSDAADVYALLEVRLNGEPQRLATAWFRSDDIQEDLTTITLPFVYGELDNSYPAYMQPENGQFVPANQVAYILPTHISFVASSSFGGANFAGAVGSLLVIDDVELIYE